MVRYTPRSGPLPQTRPSAATKTTSGFVGFTRMAEIWPTLSSPMNRQLAPASGEKYTPCPVTMSLRGLASPVPTQMRLGFEGATAMAPIEAEASFSKIGFQDSPPSLVLDTTPAAPRGE